MLNIVQFSGGRGTLSLTNAFLSYPYCNLISIVNAYDDGKSSGELRRYFNMLGPSDIRKTQQSMIPRSDPNKDHIDKLFDYRFPDDADHDLCLGAITDFAEGRIDRVLDLIVEPAEFLATLREISSSFVIGLKDAEYALGKKFNFADCSFINCLYAGAFLLFQRDFARTTAYFDKLFGIRGTVLNTNSENKKLIAIRESGEVLYSEAEIVELRSNVRVRDIYIVDDYPDRDLVDAMSIEDRHRYLRSLQTSVIADSAVLRAIADADILIYGPGTQHSSLYPSYMALGVPDAIAHNEHAVKIFICNIGEDYETPQYTASELIKGAHRYLNKMSKVEFGAEDLFDYAFVNTPGVAKQKKYIRNDTNEKNDLGVTIVADDFEDPNDLGKHNGAKLASLSIQYLRESLSRQAHAA